MAINIIEQACLKILSELKSNKFTRPKMELLHKLFSELVKITGKKLGD